MRGGLPQLLRRNPDFRRLFLSTLISLTGDWFSLVAVSGMVTEVTGGDAAASIVYAAAVLPIFLLSTPAGMLSDRFDRRRLMVVSNLLRVPSSALLIVAIQLASPTLAIAAVALTSALSALHEPAALAATPNLVDDADLDTAQAAMGAAWGSMLLVGAGLGGLAAAVLGRELTVAADVASFLVAALLLARITRPTSAPRDAADPGGIHAASIGYAGLRRYLRATPVVRALIFTKPGAGVSNGIVGLLPGFATHRFGAGDLGIGFLIAARGAGAMLGPLLARGVAAGPGGRLLGVCGIASLTYAASYALLPLMPTLALAAVFVTLAHIGGGGQWMLSTVALQRAVPDALRGRVLGLDYAIATAAIGSSALLAALLTTLLGRAHATWLLAGLSAGYGLAWLAWTRGLRRGPDPLAARGIGEGDVRDDPNPS